LVEGVRRITFGKCLVHSVELCFGKQKFEIERMVVDYIGDYKGTNLRKFGISLCK
jgi:hypothetical protein